MQTIVMYPLTTADIYCDAIRKQAEHASSVELTLEDTMPGQPPKGSVFVAFQHCSCVIMVLLLLMIFVIYTCKITYFVIIL